MIMPETSGPDVTYKKISKLWKTKLNNIVLGGRPENSLQVLYYWWWWTRGGEDCGGCLSPQLDHSLLQCSIAEERNAWQQSHIINITTIFMTFYIAIIVWFNRQSRFDIIISRYLKFCQKLEKSLSAVVLSTNYGWMLLLHSGNATSMIFIVTFLIVAIITTTTSIITTTMTITIATQCVNIGWCTPILALVYFSSNTHSFQS